MDELPPTPPPWIEQYQREHLTGDSALTTFQGRILDELILPRSALDANDPAALVNAALTFVNAMENEALLLPGEYPQEALWSFFAQDYVTQARDGGHVQYFVNRGDDSMALKLSQFGLKSMIADPHLSLFTQFMRLKRAEPKQARKLAEQAGYRSVEAAIRGLDDKMNALEQSEPLMPRHKTWIKSLRKLRVVPDEEWRQQVARVAAANPLYSQRIAERERLREETQSSDPAFQTARSLCDQAGLRMTGLGTSTMAPTRTVWPEGPSGSSFVWRVDTDQGQRMLVLYTEGGMFKKRLAVLIAQGDALPVGSIAMSKEEFEAIAPGQI